MYLLLYRILLIIILLSGCENVVNPEIQLSLIDSVDYALLKTHYPISISDPKQYESTISAFEKSDRENHPRDSVVLFLGSSTITLWNNNLQYDFPSINALGHGFGGSVMMQQHYYFDRIVSPLHVKKCILYCENDIGGNTKQIYDLFRYFDYRFHERFPKTMLYIISFKPSIARKWAIPQMKIVNDSLKAFASRRDYTDFVDVFHAMLPNDSIDPSIYSEDGLHMNRKGYEIWISKLKPYIYEYYNLP